MPPSSSFAPDPAEFGNKHELSINIALECAKLMSERHKVGGCSLDSQW